MKFDEFQRRFGGSFRTKHLCVLPTNLWGRIVWCVKFLVRRKYFPLVRKRLYDPPRVSSLPKDFIRLEPWEAEYLFLLASRARRGIVEIGRYRGGSTFLMACANAQVPIYSVDLAPQDDARLNSLFDEHGVGQNVKLIVGDSQLTQYPEIGDFDLLFIDGDHSYQGCTNDLNNWFPHLAENGHLILHDCYHGCEVQSSMLDFIERHDVQVVRSPYIISSHWQTSCGSVVHAIKPRASRLAA